MDNIPGILIINTTQRFKGPNKFKQYYKCYLNSKSNEIEKKNDPILVPYDIHMKTFSKKIVNKYVIVDQNSKKIVETIGPVNDFNRFCKYQLYCKNLIRKSLKNFKENRGNSEISTLPFLDRNVYTIDPKGSKDFDDAFSITGNTLSIYITNVPLYFDSLLDLERVSTIYFPKPMDIIPMFPKKISENICSLCSDNCDKIVLTLDYDLETGHTKLYNSRIKVQENLEYGSNNIIVGELMSLVKKIQLNLGWSFDLNDDHDAIAILMIFFNNYCAKLLKNNGVGIFRSCSKKNDKDQNFLKFLDYSSEYSLENSNHSMLGLGEYTHITSPIRRIVDLINVDLINKILNKFCGSLGLFEKWSDKIDQLNRDFKSIKKIQNQAQLLNVFIKNPDQIYKGVVIDQETVYLKDLKGLFKFEKGSNDFEKGSENFFKIFVFDDSASFKKKIRLQVV